MKITNKSRRYWFANKFIAHAYKCLTIIKSFKVISSNNINNQYYNTIISRNRPVHYSFGINHKDEKYGELGYTSTMITKTDEI